MNCEPLHSQLIDDEDVRDLVIHFVRGLPGRARVLGEALERMDLPALAAAAHKLRGAAGCFGFPSLSAVAFALDEAAVDGDEAKVRALMDEVLSLCARATAGIANVSE